MSVDEKSGSGRIEFRCACGTRFRVDAELAGRRGRCTTCGASLTIPTGSAVPPSPSETGDPVAATLPRSSSTAVPAPAAAGGEESVDVQAVCSICQCPIDAGDPQMQCPQCHLPFHSDCWQENLGCSTYGCPQVNILRKGPDIKLDNLPGTAGDQHVWHCAIGDRFYGPASALEVAAWMREGRVTVNTMVWRNGMQTWQPIASMADLLLVVNPGYRPVGAHSDFPWELALLPASVVVFLLGLMSYGIPSILATIGVGIWGGKKASRAGFFLAQGQSSRQATEPWPPRYIAVTAVAFVISLIGFIVGLIVCIDSA